MGSIDKRDGKYYPDGTFLPDGTKLSSLPDRVDSGELTRKAAQALYHNWELEMIMAGPKIGLIREMRKVLWPYIRDNASHFPFSIV